MIRESIIVIQTIPFTNEEYSKIKENRIDGKDEGPDESHQKSSNTATSMTSC